MFEKLKPGGNLFFCVISESQSRFSGQYRLGAKDIWFRSSGALRRHGVEEGRASEFGEDVGHFRIESIKLRDAKM